MKRLRIGVLLVASACGAGSKDVLPRLPGDGDAHTARPRDPSDTEGGDDAWSGRRDLVAAPAPLQPQALAMPAVERFTLKNGLRVIAVSAAGAGTFQVQVAVRAGRRNEKRDKVGLSNAVAQMLTRGARGKTRAQIVSTMEQAGAELRADASYEATLVTCHAPEAGQAACLGTVGAVLSAPSFPAAAFTEVQGELAAAARQGQMDPAQLANLHFQNELWGDEHVRGWPMTERTVAAIKREDLVAWHKTHFTPKNAVMLVVSDQLQAGLAPALERAFGAWRGEAPPPAERAPDPATRGIQIRLVDLPGLKQAHVRVGRLGVAHRDADFAAASVVNQALGGSAVSSRIARAVRKAYGDKAAASTSFDRNLERGAFVAGGVVASAQAVELMRLLMDQIGKMGEDGPSDDEVRAAVTELAGAYQARFESNGEIGAALLAAELHGFGQDYVRDFGPVLGKVTAASARDSAERWLDGKNLVVVLAGNAQEIEPQLIEASLSFARVSHTDPVAKYEREAIAKAASAPPDPKEEAAARKILDAALAAKGGADKVGAVKTLSWKGKATLNLPGGKVPAQVEKRFTAPDKLRLDMLIEMGGAKVTITTALLGNSGWAQETRPDGARVIDFPPSEVEAGKAQIWRDQDFVLLRHLEKGAVVAPLPDVELDGAPHHAIRVTAPDGKRTVTLLIDKKTRRLGGMTYTESGVSAEETFGDYRAVGGIQVAHSRTTKSAQVDLVTTVTEVKLDPKIDNSVYNKPKK